jgi:hypothetical protein
MEQEQTWEVDQPVIVFRRFGGYGGDDHAVYVHKIKSVAPKSFVAGNYRFNKSRLQARVKGLAVDTVYEVCRMDDPRAAYLLAERASRKAMNKVTLAEHDWSTHRTVENAKALQVALYAWTQADKARTKAHEELKQLQGGRPLLDRSW